MKKKKEYIRGSFTIEAAVIVPLILFVFAALIYILFYYHDKNVLTAVAHETVCMGCDRREPNATELERYFDSHTKDRLLLFTWVKSNALIEEKQISLTVQAGKKEMTVNVDCTMKRTKPENYIRKKRLENYVENIL